MSLTKPSWKSVKTKIAYWNKTQLLGLVQDLYGLNKANADFLNARLLDDQDSVDALAPYKQRIERAVSPKNPWLHDMNLSEGRKAISEYRKSKGDAYGLLTLMLHYVRCGNTYSLQKGDINARFYNSMRSMVAQFCKELLKHEDQDLAQKFIPLLDAEFQRITKIGWGYPYDVGYQLVELKRVFSIDD